MNLFAYGTLIDSEIMRRVAGELPARAWGTLAGYERRALKDKTYPGLMKKGPASVRGIVYSDLSADAWEKLDRFEGDRYAREKVTVALDDGSASFAWVYVTVPEFLGELSAEGWDYEDFVNKGKAAFEELYEGFDR